MKSSDLERIALRTLVDKIKAVDEAETWKQDYLKLKSELTDTQKLLNECIYALEWYACRDNWRQSVSGEFGTICRSDLEGNNAQVPVNGEKTFEKKAGKRARAALRRCGQ